MNGAATLTRYLEVLVAQNFLLTEEALAINRLPEALHERAVELSETERRRAIERIVFDLLNPRPAQTVNWDRATFKASGKPKSLLDRRIWAAALGIVIVLLADLRPFMQPITHRFQTDVLMRFSPRFNPVPPPDNTEVEHLSDDALSVSWGLSTLGHRLYYRRARSASWQTSDQMRFNPGPQYIPTPPLRGPVDFAATAIDRHGHESALSAPIRVLIRLK
jgi:hypothetical protein